MSGMLNMFKNQAVTSDVGGSILGTGLGQHGQKRSLSDAFKDKFKADDALNILYKPPVKQVTAPVIETPADVRPMPLPNDQSVKTAQRKSIMQQLARRGRASTIMTGDEETLG